MFGGKILTLHPFLFASHFVLFLYAINADRLPPHVLIRPLWVILATMVAVHLSLKFFLKDRHKAGFLSSLWVIFIFTVFKNHGWIKDVLSRFQMAGWFWGVLGLLVFLIVRTVATSQNNFQRFTRWANVCSIALVLASIIMIVQQQLSNSFHLPTLELLAEQPIKQSVDGKSGMLKGGGFPFVKNTLNGSATTSKIEYPNIYYIILDAYSRQDVLKEIYDYDNSYFLHFLREKGFYVANQSLSNYTQTAQSLSSSLNLCYVNGLTEFYGRESSTFSPYMELIRHNRVSQFLKLQHYTRVGFATGTHLTDQNLAADIDLRPRQEISGFENMLLGPDSPVKHLQAEIHRKRIRYIFQKLKELAMDQRRLYVFAHIYSPHPPFVFDGKGNAVNGERFNFNDGNHFIGKSGDKESYIRNYREQIAYITAQVQETVEVILKNSKTPPIIILQGDHGARSQTIFEDPAKSNAKEASAILNACYLPGVDAYELLYDTVTPVNTFRIIFNAYFNQALNLLEDKTYAASYPRSFDFIDITDRARQK